METEVNTLKESLQQKEQELQKQKDENAMVTEKLGSAEFELSQANKEKAEVESREKALSEQLQNKLAVSVTCYTYMFNFHVRYYIHVYKTIFRLIYYG